MDNEKLGPAERIIQTVLAYSDHLYHGRPGLVVKDTSAVIGVKWSPVTHKVEGAEKVVYVMDKVGKKTTRTRVGVIQNNGQIKENGRIIGDYRPAGLFPEVAVWMYRQVGEVWRLDNEFAAHWASYAYGQEHRDLKVVLAAFMLCQSRKGDPVLDQGKIAFHDEDFRDIGEAMMLLHDITAKQKRDLNPKLLLRIYDVLNLPGVAAVNRELGFGRSARRPFFGRWEKAVEKWLRYREENPRLLDGLVKAGFRGTVMNLARRTGYKPETARFFERLRWKQAQAKDGRRSLAIGAEVSAAESWENLTEQQICETIVRERPSFKRIVGLVPKAVGVTRAIMAAAIEAGALSQKDLVIATPTLEDLGLLNVQDIREKWERAVKWSEDTRAANIATRVKSKDLQDKLQEGADEALKNATAEVLRDMRVYFCIDISGSMQGAVEKAKDYIAKFLPAFPLDRLHVSVFNTAGRAIEIKHASAVGVQNALRGILAGGGTHYSQGVQVLSKYPPKAEEDVIMIFIGDEEDQHANFVTAVQQSGLRPMAFGLVRVLGTASHGRGMAVRTTAAALGIPCFEIDERIFADAYAVPRTIRTIIASTPTAAPTFGVQASRRVSLVDQIVNTKLLQKPAWASA